MKLLMCICDKKCYSCDHVDKYEMLNIRYNNLTNYYNPR